MTAIIKKIKVGLSQEEIDRIQQSVIDLGTITESVTSTTNSVLNATTTSGLYTFIVESDYPVRYFMIVGKTYTEAETIEQTIFYSSGATMYKRVIRGTPTTATVYSYSLDATTAQKCAASGDTLSKLFLIGRTSQSSTGGTTYSHDTVYVDTDGHLYDDGKQVKTATDLSTTSSNKTISGNFMIVSIGFYTGSMHAVDINDVRYQTFSYDSTGNAFWTFKGTKISNDTYVLETLCNDGTTLGHARVQTAAVSAIEGKTYKRTLVNGDGGGQVYLINDL